MRSITDGRQRRHRMADGIGEGCGGGQRRIGRGPEIRRRRDAQKRADREQPLADVQSRRAGACEWAARSLCDFVLRRPHRPGNARRADDS